MAYVTQERNRAATLAAVGALHVAAVYALVTGLAGPVWDIVTLPPLAGEQIPLPKPSPTPIEPARPVADPRTTPTDERNDGRQVVTITPIDTTGDVADIKLPPLDGGLGDRILDPDPPLDPPIQTFAAKAPAPRGTPGGWVTPNDYPAADLRAEHEGTTRFRLSIDVDGKVTNCAIVRSSGHPSLDAAACARLTNRARFTPATDATGARTAGSYTSAVVWTIPKR